MYKHTYYLFSEANDEVMRNSLPLSLSGSVEWPSGVESHQEVGVTLQHCQSEKGGKDGGVDKKGLHKSCGKFSINALHSFH